MDVQVEPVYVAPYMQTVEWTRPDSVGDKFALYISGDRYADILHYDSYAADVADVVEHSLY